MSIRSLVIIVVFNTTIFLVSYSHPLCKSRRIILLFPSSPKLMYFEHKQEQWVREKIIIPSWKNSRCIGISIDDGNRTYYCRRDKCFGWSTSHRTATLVVTTALKNNHLKTIIPGTTIVDNNKILYKYIRCTRGMFFYPIKPWEFVVQSIRNLR